MSRPTSGQAADRACEAARLCLVRLEKPLADLEQLAKGAGDGELARRLEAIARLVERASAELHELAGEWHRPPAGEPRRLSATELKANVGGGDLRRPRRATADR